MVKYIFWISNSKFLAYLTRFYSMSPYKPLKFINGQTALYFFQVIISSSPLPHRYSHTKKRYAASSMEVQTDWEALEAKGDFNSLKLL